MQRDLPRIEQKISHKSYVSWDAEYESAKKKNRFHLEFLSPTPSNPRKWGSEYIFVH